MLSPAVDRRLPRALHPGAWWLWALGMATAATRTTNPLLLLLTVGIVAAVVRARRSDEPWARSFVVFLKLGLVVLAIRAVAQILFAPSAPGTVLVTLPSVDLPDWAAGVTMGGEVTDVTVATALVDGLRLAVLLGCIGAANALASPKRLLASLPAAVYEVGVSVVVALSFAPSLAGSVQRIRAARRLRGRADRGLRGMLTVALPVLEDALERSLALAAAMDSRGYGRRARVPPGLRRLTGALVLLGLLGVCLGLYGLLDGGEVVRLGMAAMVAGLIAAALGLALSGRSRVRSRYRPDPWRGPEWVGSLAGIAAAAGALATAALDPASLAPTLLPLTALPLPPLAAAGVLAGLAPMWLTPPPPSSRRRTREPIPAEVPA